MDLTAAPPDRDLDLHLAVRALEDGGHVVAETEPLSGVVEVVGDDLEVRDLGAADRHGLAAPAVVAFAPLVPLLLLFLVFPLVFDRHSLVPVPIAARGM